ncbi:hypothetical protein [Tenggerimyces flavus]|uniref:SPW repeat-containing protein n=1 Tax=Tenggerimyces flavus TaxID=1708749 RepID=A0ABV7YGJ5_9ACTN|nr:hypothetical protein [Tenggerimyces flavus]MBM7784073.1 energy-converting hydrogenase Eha subunit C [Tenggerimyces flavus]
MNAQSKAGPAELSLVALLAIGVWWLVLGWNWDVVPAGTPNDFTDPHSTLDWVLVGIAVLVGAAWLGLRGRPFAAVLMVVVPIVALSAWRMADAETIGANLWPIGALVLLLAYGATAAAGSVLGLVVRRARAK